MRAAKRAVTSRGSLRHSRAVRRARAAVRPVMSKACRKRSARTAGSVRDAERRARGDERGHQGDGRCGAHQGSQGRVPCDDRFAHRSSPARRGRSRQDVSFEYGPKSVRNAQREDTFRVASSFSPLLCPRDGFLVWPLHDRRLAFLFEASCGHPRNFDTARPLSYCYELQCAQNLESVAKLANRR